MRTYNIFVTDTRYSLPVLTIIIVNDEQRAIALADSTLIQSNFHLAVELYEGRREIYHQERPAFASGRAVASMRLPPISIGRPWAFHRSRETAKEARWDTSPVLCWRWAMLVR